VNPLLEATGLQKSYESVSGQPLAVLQGVDLVVEAGTMIAIVGESGTGKSTLLHLLGALDRPDAGSVRFRGEEVFARGDRDLARFRNESIGFVFQFHHLLPEFTAVENVAMPALIAQRPLAEARIRATALLDLLGLGDRADHRPTQLSGGEQQRVAVARALMNEPALVLADEPTGNLDVRTGEQLQDELLRLSREMGQTFVVVTHNPAFARRADRVYALKGGLLQPA
jgi:lipoprotein-releasing system ATP-binding protein